MRIPRAKGVWGGLGVCYYSLAGVPLPGTPAWVIPHLCGGVVLMVWVVWSYVTDDPVPPEVAAQRAAELRAQRIAELKNTLGYEPLNLHELHQIVMDNHKNDKEN